MFAEESFETIEESANAVGISSFDGGRSRIALLSESQPSRLHNRFVAFERATESKVVRLTSKDYNPFSREDDRAESSVPRKPRQKPSYNGQGNTSAKNLGGFSLNAAPKDARDVTSKSTSWNFSSKLKIILNNFDKQDGLTATEPPDSAASSVGLPVENTFTETTREDFWNTSTETTRDTRKEAYTSPETYSTFYETSVEDANENLLETSARTEPEAGTYSSFNLFSNAPLVPSEPRKFSSGSQFRSPVGNRSRAASSQHGHVSPRRLSRSIGSRSSPSRSSIPGKFSKYSKSPDSNHGRGPYASTAASRLSSREEHAQFFVKSNGATKSHASQELDEDAKKHQSSYDSFTGNSTGSCSLVSFPESSTQAPPQSQTNLLSKVCSDSDSEINVQAGSSSTLVVDGADHVSSLPQQSRSRSDVEDDLVDTPLISCAVVGPDAMSSLPDEMVSWSEESNASTVLSDPHFGTAVKSLTNEEMSSLNMSGVTKNKQNTMSSLPVLSAESNVSSSTFPDLDVESEHLQKSLFSSKSAAPQVTANNHHPSDLPFEFRYSYTETPNAPILRYRGPQYSPFGPMTMDRPWTGRPPPKPSKKKPRIFDSFKPPPKAKKGIKYVQDPGPFPEGQSPKAAKTREEILGDPLTKQEVAQLVEKCKNETRQVNLGRDGLTHNMLDLVHTQWKRRRVCKIKCKGVPTVDMDNVYFHIEDKTGGKIIHRNGGVIYLFRGRNYNYKDRPKIPLMLWKPASPVYPKLIQHAPGGLTKEQARKLRILGRKTASICKLGKNGVYLNLVKDVKNAFKVDDLVRIDCQGLNPSDYKKIGAKLRDLVPCVLLSFEKEHILMWKGRELDPCSGDIDSRDAATSSMEDLELEAINQASSSEIGPADSTIPDIEVNIVHDEPFMSSDGADISVLSYSANQEISPPSCLDDTQFALGASHSAAESKTPIVNANDPKSSSPLKDGSLENSQEEVKGFSEKAVSPEMDFLERQCLDRVDISSKEAVLLEYSDWRRDDSREFHAEPALNEVDQGNPFIVAEVKEGHNEMKIHSIGFTALWEQALESGMASEIDEADADTDSVFDKAERLAETAPQGPTYTNSLLKIFRLNGVNKLSDGESNMDIGRMHRRRTRKKKELKNMAEFTLLEVPPMGGMPVDELAKLLAPK